MEESIPLEFLQPGEIGVVSDLFGSPADVLRLSELGLRTGRRVEMVQPGIPCIIRLDGHKLCFRGGEAAAILVRVGDA